MTVVLHSATQFIRDNVTGGLVVKATLRADGSYFYKMEEGHSYHIKGREKQILESFGHEVRMKENTK